MVVADTEAIGDAFFLVEHQLLLQLHQRMQVVHAGPAILHAEVVAGDLGRQHLFRHRIFGAPCIDFTEAGGDLRLVLAPPVQVVMGLHAHGDFVVVISADGGGHQAIARIALAAGVRVQVQPGAAPRMLCIERGQGRADTGIRRVQAWAGGQRLFDQLVQLIVLELAPPLGGGPAFAGQVDVGRQLHFGQVLLRQLLRVGWNAGAAGQGQA